MATRDIVIGIILIVASIVLVISVLMQHGKTHNLSGTIAGGAETFFGKAKGQTIDKKLAKFTTIFAVVFVVIVLAMYLMQDATDTSGLHSDYDGNAAVTTTGTETGTDTTAPADSDTTAETTAGTEADTTGTEAVTTGTEVVTTGTEAVTAGATDTTAAE